MMGQRAAQHWLDANPDKPCRVAILDFGKFPPIEVLRTTPFFQGVKSIDPNAQLVTELNGQGDTTKSMEITLDILQADPEVNIIFGANDEMALGALAACEQIGRGKMDNGKPLTEVIARHRRQRLRHAEDLRPQLLLQADPWGRHGTSPAPRWTR